MPDPTDSPGLSTWTDDELLETYEATEGEPGQVEADRLLAEIQRRGLDL